MKKYLLLASVAFFAFAACTPKQNEIQKKAEENVSQFLCKTCVDEKSYEAVEFANIDSLKLEDTKIYKDALNAKTELEQSVNSVKEKIKALEETGIKGSEETYNQLQEELRGYEQKLTEANDKFTKFAGKEKDHVYSMKHKYKAKKANNEEVIIYNETFFIDKNNDIIEIVEM